MRAVRSTRRRIAIKKIRLLGLKKFLSPKAPAHILWLKCTGVLCLIPFRKAAPLQATARVRIFSAIPAGPVGWLPRRPGVITLLEPYRFIDVWHPG